MFKLWFHAMVYCVIWRHGILIALGWLLHTEIKSFGLPVIWAASASHSVRNDIYSARKARRVATIFGTTKQNMARKRKTGGFRAKPRRETLVANPTGQITFLSPLCWATLTLSPSSWRHIMSVWRHMRSLSCHVMSFSAYFPATNCL